MVQIKAGGTVKPRAGAPNKVAVVMDEFKEGRLHSGSKKGPLVHNEEDTVNSRCLKPYHRYVVIKNKSLYCHQ